MQREDLIGAWKLDEFEITYSDGRPPSYPFGEDALGQLVYAADGQMSAVLSRTDRDALDISRLETFSSASDAAKVAAFDSYLSYTGRWSLDGEEVTHEVELALVPNIIGRKQVRRARFDDGLLVLTYQIEARSGVTRHYQLRWKRPGQQTRRG